MEKGYKLRICSKLCSNIGTLLFIILILVLFSVFFLFPISKSFPFLLTIPIALLSTIFLVTLTKKKGSRDENLVKDKVQKEELPQPSLDATLNNQQSEIAENHEHEQLAEAHSDYSFPSDSESSNFSIMDRTFELNVQEHKLQDDLQSDSSLPSDSESSSSSIMEESFEINQNQNLDGSDSLDSDDDDDIDDDVDVEEEEEEEDSLIEINLPGNHFSDLTEDPKQRFQSKLPDSIYKQQGLMELLAEINEMNEDENLIEIDISMGSTNSPDFRLKQELAYFRDECVLSD
ncbi:ribosome biogenesis protein BOP1 homolog [Abrus precatorius]|uniref:Ribosome biogenesis protein BOP1 homolog n=1 Tax=Abrus precatorius TaxID=3816 RepID=A0A8B8KLB2_ABRPR|nr:ribosome biogenesis protein BOP1 homolog [Abrus precatorius]